jgi:hypothetical protein
VEIFLIDYHQLANLSPNELDLIKILHLANISDQLLFISSSPDSYNPQRNRILRTLFHYSVRIKHSGKSSTLNLPKRCRLYGCPRRRLGREVEKGA